MNGGKYLIQLYDSDENTFLGRNGQRVNDLQEEMIFTDGLAARLYIEMERLNRIGRIQRIVSSRDCDRNIEKRTRRLICKLDFF